MCTLDDFDAEAFDSVAHGFVGGATPNVENQRLPIQISREALPPDVRALGQRLQGSPAAVAAHRGACASSPTRCRTGPTPSTSTRATATAAGSGCRSCA